MSGGDLEQVELRIGYVALSDCAPLLIAKERGFFRDHGLRVTLERQGSWASVRDKLAAGWLDAASMLAPMPLAMDQGIDGVTLPMAVPLSLGLNGNGITVSRSLYDRMVEADADAMARRPTTAAALGSLIRRERDRGAPPLRFAVVFPFSSHHFELRYWMGAAGIDPARDVEIGVVPPAAMVERLKDGAIDGFCVGEPYNQLAVSEGVGRTVVAKYEIWNHSPEKVLAMSDEWASARPATVRALVAALIEAARWVDRTENRLEAAHVITGESRLDAPTEVTAAALCGRFRSGRDVDDRATPDFHVFHRSAATFPWVSHGMWLLTQMLRWGQIEKPISLRDAARRVYRPDWYREAARAIGEPCPASDEKVEGSHDAPWTLSAGDTEIAMGADRFLDGRSFDPADPIAYLEQFEVTGLRVRMDDLALRNG